MSINHPLTNITFARAEPSLDYFQHLKLHAHVFVVFVLSPSPQCQDIGLGGGRAYIYIYTVYIYIRVHMFIDTFRPVHTPRCSPWCRCSCFDPSLRHPRRFEQREPESLQIRRSSPNQFPVAGGACIAGWLRCFFGKTMGKLAI